jgi:predicted RND superfamily exporter protein
MGGDVIKDFAFTLMIGIVVGTYSSIFIASSIVIMITHYNEKREARMKAAGIDGKAGKKKRTYTVRPEPKFTP